MKKELFNKLVNDILILDGATGTELAKKGMPKNVCPEKWVLENADVLKKLQKEYILAGSKAVYSCTFGANKIKLCEFGLGDKVIEMNEKLVKLSKEAVGDSGFVAGDIAPTGKFIKPMGDYTFEEIVDVYKEQVKGLLKGGVDFFIIETMMDISETRAALIAVKESCDLPVCVSMTFNEDGRTLTGTSPEAAVVTLQSLGADVVGCNCSTGPVGMLEIVKRMSKYAKVPLLAKPNAGMPKLVDNETVFDMKPEEFSIYTESFIEAGVAVLGGCCGTDPQHILSLSNKTKGVKKKDLNNRLSVLSSSCDAVIIGNDRPITVVGERINPTGKKNLQKALREKDYSYILKLADEQQEAGADILDVNVGTPGVDEKETMISVIEKLSSRVKAPLCIDSSSIDTIEAALRIYPGRALINSISAEKEKIQKLLPVAAKYGAMFILLPLSDKGVPVTSDERINIIKYVYGKALDYGFKKEDISVDGLVMTVSSNQSAAKETLDVVKWVSNEFKANTILGLSNVSFGLPERGYINSAFLAMAAVGGLSMAIANPSSQLLMNIKRASDVLTFKDKGSRIYIESFSDEKEVKNDNKEAEKSNVSKIYDSIVKGNSDSIIPLIEAAIKENIKPDDIVDNYLIKAINHVGDLFEEGKYFLPQLIQSAEVMKKAFKYIEPILQKEGGTKNKKAKVVAATVKGDIHDIGKNIVILMLKNYGFDVVDLGKDVSSKEIISKATKHKADIICLSALMTTTMTEMKEVIDLAKKEKLDAKIMVGGAVVTQSYADEIGADGYAKDAQRAVKLAIKLS